MQIRYINKVFTTLLFVSAVSFLATQCGEKQNASKEKTRSMIVVYSSGGDVIRADSKTVPASVGTVVKEGDTIKTGSDQTVDLQTRNGTAVRVREFTTIKLARLSEGDTELSMKQGTMFANVKRKSKSDKFAVSTPTAIAGVRGTTFKVEVEEGSSPRVKVLEGKVAMAPRIRALETYSKEEIQKDESLKKLASLEKKEVILEANTEGSLNQEVMTKVAAVNKAVETAKAENKEVNKDASVVALAVELEKKAAPKTVTKEDSAADVRDIQQTSTLVAVDADTFDRMRDDVRTRKTVSPEDVVKIQKKREENQKKVLEKIEKEASKKELKNEKEIAKHYGYLELIKLKDGTRLKGHVIAQTGSVMVIHTAEGVKRVRKSQVAQQEFVN